MRFWAILLPVLADLFAVDECLHRRYPTAHFALVSRLSIIGGVVVDMLRALTGKPEKGRLVKLDISGKELTKVSP